MGAKGCDAARAMRRDLVPLVDQVPVPQLLDDPPAALDVAVIESDVGVVHVYPETDAFRQLFPLLYVAHDALAAEGVELVDSVFFNLLFGGDAQLLLYLDLHRQPVGVPAAFAKGPEALHGLVARDDVLEHTA